MTGDTEDCEGIVWCEGRGGCERMRCDCRGDAIVGEVEVWGISREGGKSRGGGMSEEVTVSEDWCVWDDEER